MHSIVASIGHTPHATLPTQYCGSHQPHVSRDSSCLGDHVLFTKCTTRVFIVEVPDRTHHGICLVPGTEHRT
jgi:hypothetical protein